MLKHGRAGVPMEVMGLMLGKSRKFLDFIQFSLEFSLDFSQDPVKWTKSK